MLWVYAGLNLVECDRLARLDLPKGYTDLSKTSTSDLVREIETVQSHFPGAFIYVGYVDPILMLNPQHDTRCRRAFRGCTVSVVVSNPFLLPYSWKNGTDRLTVIGENKILPADRNANASTSETLHDGGSPHVPDEAGHGRNVEQHAPKGRNHKNRKARDSA
jgi:hypothetical protein